MKKKYVLGSIIVILLMLVSTQVVFLDIVKSSDPDPHEGNAWVGDLWISELDVSSELQYIDNIGISHSEANDDWVIWLLGAGNIKVNWSTDIGYNHPEYYVIFTFEVINVDDNCNEIGNSSVEKTYLADTLYDESGTLSVNLQFSQEQKDEGSQTLVCVLGAYVQVRNSPEANNFSCLAQDRCVVGVEFTSTEGPDFSLFRDEANDDFPSMWSWIDGWEEGGKFNDQDDMLNTLTFFAIGKNNSNPQQNNSDWYLGNISLWTTRLGRLMKNGFTVGNETVNWSLDANDFAKGKAFFEHGDIFQSGVKIDVYLRMVIWPKEPILPDKYIMCYGGKKWEHGDGAGYVAGNVTAHNSSDEDHDGDIEVNGFIWGRTLNIRAVQLDKVGDYRIIIDSNATQDTGTGGSYYWEESCAYQNLTSSSISVDSSCQGGVTTIEVDISDILDSSDEGIYSFAADRGDTIIEFTC